MKMLTDQWTDGLVGGGERLVRGKEESPLGEGMRVKKKWCNAW